MDLQKRRTFLLEQPFDSEEDEKRFGLSLVEWKDYSQKHLILRRKNYSVSHFLTMEEIKEEASAKISLKEQKQLLLWKGNLVELEIDAIVNAANGTLLGGGGVDHIIHQAAGPLLVKECAKYKEGCKVGDAKITKGYRLPASFVIHTVGPRLKENGDPDEEKLLKCYESCLEICETFALKSVAFPCISCGIFGFPLSLSAKIVPSFIQKKAKSLKKVKNIILCVFSNLEEKHYLEFFSE